MDLLEEIIAKVPCVAMAVGVLLAIYAHTKYRNGGKK